MEDNFYKARVCYINKKELQTVAFSFDKFNLLVRLLTKKFVKYAN